jgi:hypothetical protein
MTDNQGGGGNGGSTPSSGPSWAAIGGILVGVAAVITAIVAFLGLFIDNDGDGSATTVVAVQTSSTVAPSTSTTAVETTTTGAGDTTTTTAAVITTTTTLPALDVFIELDPAVYLEDEEFIWFGAERVPFLFPGPLGAVGPAPEGSNCRPWYSWSREHGGIDGELTMFELILEGKSDSTVVVDGIEVEIVQESAPLRGLATICQQFGGAEIDPRRVGIDLDRDPPQIDFYPDGQEPESSFALQLANGEVEILEVWATTSDCDCLWRLRLNYAVGGERHTLLIDADGEPFRTSGIANSEVWQWDPIASDWIQQ